MRKFLFFVGVILLAFPVWAAAPQTDDQKALYALGAGVGKQLEVLNLSPEEYEFVKQGMADAATGQKLAIEPEAYAQQINQLAQSRIQAAVQKQKELSKPYLEKAASEPGAKKNRIRVDLSRNQSRFGGSAESGRHCPCALHRNVDQRERIRQLREAR